MQTRTGTRTATGLLFILLATLLYAPQAEAATLVAPSTVWGHTYAAEASGVLSVPATQSANLEKRSKFVVNYKNFPDWAKNEVQVAIDLWAANFDSKVQINVDATWSRSSTADVLGSAHRIVTTQGLLVHRIPLFGMHRLLRMHWLEKI
jgi:hypothetical protein